MVTVGVLAPEISEKELEWEVTGRLIENIIEWLQVPDQLSEEKLLHTLKFLEVKISSHKMPISLCQKVTNCIMNYLRIMKPQGEMEKMCTTLLTALGFYCPGMVTFKLWSKFHESSLPPMSLLVAMGKLSRSQEMATYIGSTWEYILRLLRKAQRENDMLAICQVLSGLAISARKYLELSNGNEVIEASSKSLSIKACQTLRVLFNRWPLMNNSKVTEQALLVIGHLFFLMPSPKLKNQVNWLTRRLMSLMEAKLKPVYISQCIYKLLGALAVSGSGGINLASQLENIVGMLFKQVSEKVNNSDPHAVQNYSFALKAFYTLTKLYTEEIVTFLQEALKSREPIRLPTALTIFKCVFWEVPQTKTLKNEVIKSVVALIEEDFPVAQLPLLQFMETLAQCDYLALPQGCILIDYVIKLMVPKSSETSGQKEEEIQKACSKILQMVALPHLVNLVCDPNYIMAFVPLSKTVLEMALKAQSRGQTPYLSNFHLSPTQFISPQKVLTYIVLLCVKPYKENDLGTSSLRLLHALHPITSLHPVIHSNLGQLWKKEIPELLHILDVHTKRNLNQKKWENRLLQFLSQSLMAISDDNWLKQLIINILGEINNLSSDGETKVFLYKFFGFALRTSNNQRLVRLMLTTILKTNHEELLDKEGIAVAFSTVSRRYLKMTLDKLQEFSTILTKDTSPILMRLQEDQQKEWGLVCDTLYLSYSKIILETKASVCVYLDDILILVLQHYSNCIVEKDKNLKLDYLNSLGKLTRTMSNLSGTLQVPLPHKVEVVTFMMALIKEEPMNCISSSIRQKAMGIITDFKYFKPLLVPDEREELLQTCYKRVLCLPPVDVMNKEAANPTEAQANADLLSATLQSLLKLMEALTIEMPTRIQNCLEFLDTWVNSQHDHVRERAMWCAARILGFTSKMNNFQTEIKFTRLGRLVRLLALRCQDPVDNICFLSAHAVYNLYCILLLQKKMGRKKQGLWEEEDKGHIYSANVFYNNTSQIAKAFAEYFTTIQLTNLVLTAIEGLVDSRAKISLAAAQLMSAVMKERGNDMIKIEEIVEGIFERLKSNLEPSTKEEVLRAMCSLAGNNSNTVVPMLLKKPLPWDRTNLALWKMFGSQQETTFNILQMLIDILETNQSKQESKEMALQPVAATCALCEMLSGSECQEAVQEFYPRLLLAVLGHLYWVIEQNAPQNMVVYSKERSQEDKSKPLDPTSCALEAVKLVLWAAAYEKVVLYASLHHCWDRLSSPKFFYIGIMDLTSGLVMNCEPHILHRLLNRARNLLYCLDNRKKTLARTLYAQLLWHRSVAQNLGHDFLGNLIKWVKEPSLIMKEIGLRGISNLALHPQHSQNLKSLVPFLRSFLKGEVRVTVQAVKALRNIIYNGHGEDTKVSFCIISKQLCPLINDEREQVRIVAISSLGHMLHRVDKYKPGPLIRREIYMFLVPLLISIQDTSAEVVKACGGALTEWTNVIGWSSLTQMFQHITLSDHIQVLEETCKYLVGTNRKQFVGEFLYQAILFLERPQPFLQAAAVTFLGLIAKRLDIRDLHEDDVKMLQDALKTVMTDAVEPVHSLADTVLKRIDINIKSKSTVPSRLSRLSMSLLKGSGIADWNKKKRLFRAMRRDEDNGIHQKEWSKVLSYLTVGSKWCHNRVEHAPFIIDSLCESPKTQEEILLPPSKSSMFDSELEQKTKCRCFTPLARAGLD